MNEKTMMSRQQAADYMSIGLSSIDKMIARRDNPLPHIKVGRRVVIPKAALETWIEEEIERQTGGGM